MKNIEFGARDVDWTIPQWLHFTHQGLTGFGMVDKDTIRIYTGDLFDGAILTGGPSFPRFFAILSTYHWKV